VASSEPYRLAEAATPGITYSIRCLIVLAMAWIADAVEAIHACMGSSV
jgi:hypothetical protein